MKIPKQFKLLGSTIKVSYGNGELKKANLLGMANYDKNERIIDSRYLVRTPMFWGRFGKGLPA